MKFFPACCNSSGTIFLEMNLGLDRRVLVDEKFGYFKNI